MNRLSFPDPPIAFAPPGAFALVILDVEEKPVITNPIAIEIPDFQNT